MENPCDNCRRKLEWQEAESKAEIVRQKGIEDWTADDEMCLHEIQYCDDCPVRTGLCTAETDCHYCYSKPNCPFWE